MFQCVATFTHCPDLHSILWEEMERTQHLYDSLVVWAGKLNLKKCSEHLLHTTKLNAETSKKKIVHIGQKEPPSFFPFSTYNKIELEPKTHALDFTDCVGGKNEKSMAQIRRKHTSHWPSPKERTDSVSHHRSPNILQSIIHLISMALHTWNQIQKLSHCVNGLLLYVRSFHSVSYVVNKTTASASPKTTKKHQKTQHPVEMSSFVIGNLQFGAKPITAALVLNLKASM